MPKVGRIYLLAREGGQGWEKMWHAEYVLSGAEKLINRRMEKYSSDVFQTSLLGQKMSVFCGPKGNKFLIMNEDILVKSWWPRSSKRAIMPPELMDKDMNFSQVSLWILKARELKRIHTSDGCYDSWTHWMRREVLSGGEGPAPVQKLCIGAGMQVDAECGWSRACKEVGRSIYTTE